MSTDSIMKKLLVVLPFSAFVFVSPSHAETPCDFKGLSVGDKMTPAQAMNALGVAKFKTNPTRPSFEEEMQSIEKYGMIASGELRDWKIGPYCDNDSCRIPYGISVGNNNIPVSVFFSVRGGLITEIDVSFGESFWDEIVPIIREQIRSLLECGKGSFGDNRL